MERHVPFTGTQQQLDDRLSLAERNLDLRVAGDTVSDGNYLALHPDDLPWSARVTLEDGRLMIRGITRGAPWSRNKRARILDHRVNELTEVLAGRTDVRRQRLSSFGPGIKGVCTMLVWTAVSASAAIAAALIPLLVAGVILVKDVVQVLDLRAATLEGIGVLPLPSSTELAAIDWTFLFGASLVLMLPVAFLFGCLTALVQVLGELFRIVSRWAAIILVLPWALLLAGLWSAMGPVAATCFTALTAVSTICVVRFLWSRRREVVAPPGPSAAYLTLFPLLIVVLFVLLVPGNGTKRDKVGTVRDRFLLPTATGRSAATFYYRHTLYAAETYKPSFSNPFTATRRDPGFLRSALTTQPGLPLAILGLQPEICSPQDARTTIRERRHDFYLLPVGAEWKAAAREAGIEDRTVFVTEDMKVTEIAVRLEQKNSEATGLRALTSAGWNALLFGGPVYLLLLVLAVAGLTGIRFRRAAPVILVIAQLIPVIVVVGLSYMDAGVRNTHDQVELAALLTDTDAGSRAVAASHAARLLPAVAEREPKLFTALLEAVHDEEIAVRTWAVLALARYGDDRAVPELIGCLRDDAFLVRYRAAAAFRDLRAPSARLHLEERMREDAWYVGMQAFAALRSFEPDTTDTR